MWQDSQDWQKWADEQNKARQDEMNQWWIARTGTTGGGPAEPASAGGGPGAARPPQPTAKQPKTHTVTIYNGNQVTRKTFVMQDDGSWQPAEGLGTDTVAPAAPAAGPPFDPAAFRQMVLQNQERVPQQILQTRQQMMQRIGR